MITTFKWSLWINWFGFLASALLNQSCCLNKVQLICYNVCGIQVLILWPLCQDCILENIEFKNELEDILEKLFLLLLPLFMIDSYTSTLLELSFIQKSVIETLESIFEQLDSFVCLTILDFSWSIVTMNYTVLWWKIQKKITWLIVFEEFEPLSEIKWLYHYVNTIVLI